jgi:hypothetical protein
MGIAQDGRTALIIAAEQSKIYSAYHLIAAGTKLDVAAKVKHLADEHKHSTMCGTKSIFPYVF